jgi:hypothetical protein
MRGTIAGMVSVTLAASITPIYAQNPPNSLLAGETARVICNPSTYLNRGFSTFQRNVSAPPAAGGKAVISFNEIFDELFELSGQAVITFTTPTTGTIRFKQTQTPPPAVPSNIFTVNFSAYAETLDLVAQRMTVNLTLAFPDCSMPILGVYDSAL